MSNRHQAPLPSTCSSAIAVKSYNPKVSIKIVNIMYDTSIMWIIIETIQQRPFYAKVGATVGFPARPEPDNLHNYDNLRFDSLQTPELQPWQVEYAFPIRAAICSLLAFW